MIEHPIVCVIVVYMPPPVVQEKQEQEKRQREQQAMLQRTGAIRPEGMMGPRLPQPHPGMGMPPGMGPRMEGMVR